MDLMPKLRLILLIKSSHYPSNRTRKDRGSFYNTPPSKLPTMIPMPLLPRCVHRTTPLGRIQGRIFCWTLPPHPCMDLPCYCRNLHQRSQFYQPYFFGRISATVKSFAKFTATPSASLLCCMVEERFEGVFTGQDFNDHLVFDPPSKVWIRSIRDFVQHENMTSAAIVLDRSFVIDKNQRMLLANLPCKHLMTYLEFQDTEVINAFLTKMRSVGIQNYFVVAEIGAAGRFIDQAFRLGVMVLRQRPNFFVLTKNTENVECPQCSEAKLIKLKPQIANSPIKEEVLAFAQSRLGNDNGTSHSNFSQVDFLYIFDTVQAIVTSLLQTNIDSRKPAVSCETRYTGVKSTKPSEATTATATKNLSWFFETEHQGGILGSILSRNEKSNMIVDAKLDIEEQTITFTDTRITQQLGTWSHRNGLMDPKGKGRFPRAVTSSALRVAVVVQEPFIIRTKNETTPYKGYLIDLMQKIANELQIQYELYEVPDQQFGAMDDNGEWNGLIRELVDKKADIGLAPLSVMAERENVVDFTVPYFDLVGITILMKKPNQEQSLFKFVTVLEAPVWASIFGAYLVTSLLMFAFDRLSPYSYRNLKAKEREKSNQQVVTEVVAVDVKVADLPTEGTKRESENTDEYGTRIFTLKESLWFCMTSLTPQGGGEAPRNLSGRLVAATWWMFGFIIIASYTANLAAFLTVSRLEQPVGGLDDLMKQYGIRYGPVENSATETYFKRMWKIEERFYEIWRDMSLNESMSEKERAELAVWDYPVSDKYTKLWLTMKDFPRPKTTEEGIEWVKATNTTESGEKDGFALIGDAATLQYTANLDCDLNLVGEEFSRKPYALAVQEGSPLRDQLSGVILKLLNQRELELMKEQWWQMDKQKACGSGENENEGISIQNIGGVFILVLAGTVLACIMLAFEYYWYKRRLVREFPQVSQKIEMTTVGSVQNINYPTPISPSISNRSHNVFSETAIDKKGVDNKAFERRESNIAKEIRQRKQPNQVKPDETEAAD
ncbi:hypothetical protein RvY_07557-2 [Ramazzottius varieornatus]|uniref:Ionotropic glutamate receptor C-terminal domain-containing protein n=1 Tax=Ramazzottius varieornatus TaxID=947166 RepID=A0A1D1V2M5_RAMVA|nr:hypothetical protein RvY_07557-2 [Ramazzottius varieornatus]